MLVDFFCGPEAISRSRPGIALPPTSFAEGEGGLGPIDLKLGLCPTSVPLQDTAAGLGDDG